MDRIECLMYEISEIADSDIRQLVIDCMFKVPDYFFAIPASSTGKHHPSYALGEGGLVRHTKAAVKIAMDLLSLEQNSTMDRDSVIAALILHDVMKNGPDNTGYTEFKHPLYAADLIGQWRDDHPDMVIGTRERVSEIMGMITCHMGQWNKDTKHTDPFTSPAVLPKPRTKEQQLVHTCDYLASRGYLTVNLEG